MDFVPLFATLSVLVSQAVAEPVIPFKRGDDGVHLRCHLDHPLATVLTLETFSGDDRPRFGLYDPSGKFISDPDMTDWDGSRLNKHEMIYIAETFSLTVRYEDRSFRKVKLALLSVPGQPGARPMKCERVGPIVMNP